MSDYERWLNRRDGPLDLGSGGDFGLELGIGLFHVFLARHMSRCGGCSRSCGESITVAP